jgi:hypothetical protein
MRTIRCICYSVLLCGALLAAPHALAQGQSSNLVLLSVNDAQSALTYHANGSNHGRCQQTSEPGCIRVTGKGQVTFRLVGNPQCGGQAFWELSGVELGGENSDSKPGQWGGLRAEVAADFGADAQTGSISTGKGNSITIQDHNSEAYSIWYRVLATCGERTIYFDPRLENDGTGEAPL